MVLKKHFMTWIEKLRFILFYKPNTNIQKWLSTFSYLSGKSIKKKKTEQNRSMKLRSEHREKNMTRIDIYTTYIRRYSRWNFVVRYYIECKIATKWIISFWFKMQNTSFVSFFHMYLLLHESNYSKLRFFFVLYWNVDVYIAYIRAFHSFSQLSKISV